MTAHWFRTEFDKSKTFNASLPPHARLVVSAPVTPKEDPVPSQSVAPAPTSTLKAHPIAAATLAQALDSHAPDFDGDGDAGWITCTCDATFPTGIPGDLTDWWNHLQEQVLDNSIASSTN